MKAIEKIKNFFKGICKSLTPTRMYGHSSWRARRLQRQIAKAEKQRKAFQEDMDNMNGMIDDIDKSIKFCEDFESRVEKAGKNWAGACNRIEDAFDRINDAFLRF